MEASRHWLDGHCQCGQAAGRAPSWGLEAGLWIIQGAKRHWVRESREGWGQVGASEALEKVGVWGEGLCVTQR